MDGYIIVARDKRGRPLYEKPCILCGKPLRATGSAIRKRQFCGRACDGKARERQPVAERFWAKVDKDGPVVRSELGPCWVWTGYCDRAGYGHFKLDGMPLAHRVAWMLTHGEMPALFVLHRCDNRACCNPEHLFLGTHQDNMDDMGAKGRRVSRAGVLHHGAKLTDASVLRVRDLHATGVETAQLAKQFGVSASTVYRVVNGEIWRHLL